MSLSIACAPLRVVLKPSRQELVFLIVAHGFAFWGVVQSGLYVLLLGLAISCFYYLRRWLQHKGVQFLQLQDERCWLDSSDGVRQHYHLGKRHFVSDLLVIVQLRPEHRRFAPSRYFVIFCDAADADILRQLRVVLCLNQRATRASSVASE